MDIVQLIPTAQTTGIKKKKISEDMIAFENDLLFLLETGKTKTNTIWHDNDGNVINLHIAMQNLLNEDPWMNEEFNDEEKAALMLDEENFGQW